MSELKVGGSSYERIIAGKDLVADILPPPLYVVEAYLEAEQVVDDTSSLRHTKRGSRSCMTNTLRERNIGRRRRSRMPSSGP